MKQSLWSPTHYLRVERGGLCVLQYPPQPVEVRLDGDHVLLDVLRGHELLAPAAPASAVLGGRRRGRGRRPDLLPPAAPHVKALCRRHRSRRRRRRSCPGRL